MHTCRAEGAGHRGLGRALETHAHSFGWFEFGRLVGSSEKMRARCRRASRSSSARPRSKNKTLIRTNQTRNCALAASESRSSSARPRPPPRGRPRPGPRSFWPRAPRGTGDSAAWRFPRAPCASRFVEFIVLLIHEIWGTGPRGSAQGHRAQAAWRAFPSFIFLIKKNFYFSYL